MMKRDECFRALARQLGDEIVLPVYSSAASRSGGRTGA